MKQAKLKPFVFTSYYFAILFLLSQSVYALTPLPSEPYSMEAGKNNEFLFVMVPNGKFHLGYKATDYIDIDGFRYTQSGLYKNDGSGESIWTIDLFDHYASISKDGQYLVIPSTAVGETISIYNQGKLIKRYSAKELNRSETLPNPKRLISGFDSIQFDRDKNLLYVQTFSNDRYVFDVTTGKIIKHSILVNPIIYASLTTFSGKTVKLQDFMVCSHDNVATALSFSSSSSNAMSYQLIGYQLDKRQFPNKAQLWTVISAYFKNIQYIKNLGNNNDKTTNIKATFVSGESLEFFVKNKGLMFCGSDENKEHVSFAINDVKSIMFYDTVEQTGPVFERIRYASKSLRIQPIITSLGENDAQQFSHMDSCDIDNQ